MKVPVSACTIWWITMVIGNYLEVAEASWDPTFWLQLKKVVTGSANQLNFIFQILKATGKEKYWKRISDLINQSWSVYNSYWKITRIGIFRNRECTAKIQLRCLYQLMLWRISGITANFSSNLRSLQSSWALHSYHCNCQSLFKQIRILKIT